MLIIWGSGLYGKVDEVPGLFHVATKFGHLWYIPLIPTGSHLVVEQTSDGWRGVPVALSLKSVLLAWFRAALVVFGFIFGVLAIVAYGENETGHGTVHALVAAACVVLYFISKKTRKLCMASYERAHELAELVGITEEGRVLIDMFYGVITEEQGRKALEDLAALKEEPASAPPPPPPTASSASSVLQ